MKEIINAYFNQNEQEQKVYEYLLNCVNAGSNSLGQTQIIETLKIDSSWVNEVKNTLESIEKIVKNPRSFITDVREVVPVERAKRVDGVSLRHLSSHTDLIRNVDSDGNIQPSKVLTTISEHEIAIYENRFVFTLINRLNSFLKERYDAIKKQIYTVDTNDVVMHSAFNVGRTDIKCELKVKLSEQSHDKKQIDINQRLLIDIEMIINRLKSILKTPFATACGKAKPVRPPIMKTNLLVKNTDYKNCYHLWLFISSYRTIGFSVAVASKELPFDSDYYDDLTYLVATSVMNVIDNNNRREDVFQRIPSKKRKTREYRVLRRVEYSMTSPTQPDPKTPDLINQFYFDKIKELLTGDDVRQMTDIDDVREVRTTFKKFYKNIAAVNTSLCEEVLRIGNPTISGKKTLKKQTEQLAALKAMYKKHELIVKARADELAQAQKRADKVAAKIAAVEDDIKIKKETEKANRLAAKEALANKKQPKE